MKPSLRVKLSIRQMFQKKKPQKDPLDQPILQLTSKDFLTIRDSFTGTHVFGAIGSGKTSGTGGAIRAAFLRAGYGGCVCVAKQGETEEWRFACNQHGRENSLIVFNRKRHFNFLTYEFSRKGAEAANSVTDILMRILKAADMAAGQGQTKDSEAFWVKTTREMLLNTITVLYSANGTVTMDSIVAFINAMPTSEATTPEQRLKQVQNYALQTLVRFATKPVHVVPEHTRMRALTYWFMQFPSQPEKTRGSIKTSVCAELNRFTDGLLRECFCTTTDIVPEMAFNGAVIVLDFPTLSLNDEGVICQTIFKLMFQRAVESRNGLAKQFQTLPVFLYADESQFFVSEYDDTFLSTCRDSRCAVVFMTQSLPTYYVMPSSEK